MIVCPRIKATVRFPTSFVLRARAPCLLCLRFGRVPPALPKRIFQSLTTGQRTTYSCQHPFPTWKGKLIAEPETYPARIQSRGRRGPWGCTARPCHRQCTRRRSLRTDRVQRTFRCRRRLPWGKWRRTGGWDSGCRPSLCFG